MWPFGKIKALEAEIERLKERNYEYTKDVVAVRCDQRELDFLRNAIKPYVTYEWRVASQNWSLVKAPFVTRDLRAAESDLTKARLRISVLESMLGEEKSRAAGDICEKLAAMCKNKEVQAIDGRN